MILIRYILFFIYVIYFYTEFYMASLNKFKQDTTRSEEGTTVDMGDGLHVTVARIGNTKYNEVIKKLTAPHTRQIRNKTLADSVFEVIMNRAYAETILLGWKGLEDEHGKDIPYSTEKAFEILSNPEYKDFKDIIVDLASEAEAFRAAEVTATAGK